MSDKRFTDSMLSCPQCHQPVSKEDRSCPSCHTNLGLAAIEEVERIKTGLFNPTQHIAPETLFPKLGDYLVNHGVITSDQLRQTLQLQRTAKTPQPELLGQLLIQQGFVNQEELDAAVTAQILDLKTALERSNKDLELKVKQRTHELENAMRRLGELDVMKANFVANVSHELRTPLSNLVGHLELLLSEYLGEVSPQQFEALSSMTRASNRLWNLIEDLLQFSAAATDSPMLDPQPFPIMIPVQTAVSRKTPQADIRRIKLNSKITPGLPMVHADEDKITWVVEQLIDNAIKFTPPNGKVAAFARQKRNLVQIDVIDTGIGIPQDRLAEIFHPFHQLEDSMTRHYDGMGLGLARAQQILKAHGSTLQVQSRPGVGSHFAFSLPAYTGVSFS